MRITFIFGALLGLLNVSNPACAQSSFSAYIEPPPRLWATFTLTEARRFHGNVGVEFGVQGDTVQIFRSLSGETLGELLYTLPEKAGFYPTGDRDDPGSIGWIFGVDAILSQAEILELQAGNWWINVNPSPAGSEMRAQITPVPEHSSIALLTLGTLFVWRMSRRR